MTTSRIDGMRDAMARAGLTPPDEIIADGTLHRFASSGKRGDDAGWYVAHGDDLPAGKFGCWRAGIDQTWRADAGREITAEERAAFAKRMQEAQRQREDAEARRRAEAQAKARALWKHASPASDDHPYLVRKAVRAHGIREIDSALVESIIGYAPRRGDEPLDGRLLVVPIRVAAQLASVEFVDEVGRKSALSGGAKAGGYHSIGKAGTTICVVEGYATGATVHQATGYAVAVAFSAGNLLPVARAIRKSFPDVRIIVCGDDDCSTEGNPGRTKATEAAREVGGLLVVPEFGDNRPDGATDFNDVARHLGTDAVRATIDRAAPPNQIDRPARAAIEIEFISAAAVKLEAVHWLWDGWLAAGKIHILAGPPGTGKTTLALALAATITIGGRWPDGAQATPGNVVIWSGEDGIEDTLAPRLAASGADLTRIHFVAKVKELSGHREFDPATDSRDLAVTLLRMQQPPALLIVDPIVSAIAGDSHKNAEVRRSLQPLVDLGGRLGCAVLGISHFSKGTSGNDPVERVTGSIAFGALARVVLAAVKMKPSGEGAIATRLLARAKSNLGPDGGGFQYDLTQARVNAAPGIDVFASRVLWGEPVDGDAKVLLAEADADTDVDEREATDDARSWLVAILADGGGSMPLKEIQTAGKRAGFSERTLYRAGRKARVRKHTTGFGSLRRSIWTLDTVPTEPSIPAITAITANCQGWENATAMGSDGGNGVDAATITDTIPANPAKHSSVAVMAVMGADGSNGVHSTAAEDF